MMGSTIHPRDAVDSFLGRLLATEGGIVPRERYQNPKLQQTGRGVWFIRPWVDVVRGDTVVRAKKTISIGVMGKREAGAKAREIMSTINRAQYVVTSQVKFGALLDEFEQLHVARMAASTRQTYMHHIRIYLRPAFGHLMLCEIDTMLVQKWLDSLAVDVPEDGNPVTRSRKPLAWSTRRDLRNMLSGIFARASEWGRWKDRNPVQYAHCGRKSWVRQQRKLTDQELASLLVALPHDVRMLAEVCLLTCRVSEAFGLQEKHLDFAGNRIMIRQRYWRGDIDLPKNERSTRDLPMGDLADGLKQLCNGDPEHYVFNFVTYPSSKPTLCRDDRSVFRTFVAPVARALKIGWKGFGWHAFRREAITDIAARLGLNQAMRMAGHVKMDMSLHYTLPDLVAQDIAVRARQALLRQLMNAAPDKGLAN